MSDEQEQADEMCSLASIYNEEEFISSVGEDGRRSGKFFTFLSLPKGFRVVFKTYNEGKANTVVIPIEHLPPIELVFQLPEQYPSQAIPDFKLSCPWLSATKLSKLCEKLEGLWEDWKGSVILFTWTNFLKEETLELVGISDHLDITCQHLMEMRRSGKLPIEPRRRNPKLLKKLRERTPLHPRVVIPPPNIPLHRFLESYNEDRTKTTFLRSVFFCSICYQDAAGTLCTQFTPCGHVYCNKCVEQYFKMRISEAAVATMPCPYDKCPSEAHPQQVKEVVGAELFSKYDTLLLSVTLSQMGDITYCPRLPCGSPVMKEQDGKMAACPVCQYVFCVFCRRTFHGVDPCQMKSAEVKKLVEQYQNGDLNVKSQMEKRFGKSQIQKFINNALSTDWLESNSKNCPNCKASIEKSEGCNKMACTKCQTYFCWLCLRVLNQVDPYTHYNDPKSPCHKQLYLGVDIGRLPEGDDDNDDDEEFEVGPYDYDILDFLAEDYPGENFGYEFAVDL